MRVPKPFVNGYCIEFDEKLAIGLVVDAGTQTDGRDFLLKTLLPCLREELIRSTQNRRDRDIASLCEEECCNIFIWFCYVTTASSLVVTVRNRYTMSFRPSLWLLF